MKRITSNEVGAALLALLVFLFVSGIAAGGVISVQAVRLQREREMQLLFVGDQYRRAIASYYHTLSSGGSQRLPNSLDELVSDQRFPRAVQHLRRLYPDPMTGKLDWILINDGSGLVGVRSRSMAAPLKVADFPVGDESFSNRHSYSEWEFRARMH